MIKKGDDDQEDIKKSISDSTIYKTTEDQKLENNT